MAVSAFAVSEFELTGTAVTMDDSGKIRINVFNPWGKDDCHAVKSMEPIDGAVKVDVTVKVTGLEASGLGSFKLWLNGASNVDGNAVSYWESDGAAKDGCQSTIAEVSADGEYTVTLTSETAWAKGENNFLAVMSDIDAAAWGALNDGAGDTGLLSITAVKASAAADDTSATDTPSGDSSAATALILAAVAALAVAATVSVKKFAAER
ncbi:MAG: hypothetical protein NC223_11315 [Butyrivibrio sp.]|nr:hypothetical protein [Butyrivibrio sp.]